MPYDRWGRTPDMARRDRIRDWLTILALAVVVAAICTCAALVVAVMGA